MKNNSYSYFLVVVFIFFNFSLLNAKNLDIKSDKVLIDKDDQTTVFIGSVNIVDENNNKIFTNKATYNEKIGLLETVGATKIITSEGYIVDGNNILFNKIEKIISSNKNAKIVDKTGNQIFVEMFNYQTDKSLFKSRGKIKLIDIKTNDYFFSEIYIDEKANKIAGSDIRFFFNDDENKIVEKNDPRIFSNGVVINEGVTELNKAICTYCEDKENSRAPWSIKAKKITHNPATKTIYYDNAVLKIYDFPVFYYPKLSHPDPTVERASGFLIPSYKDSVNTGAGFNIPYFWAISKDKDLTFTPKLFVSGQPLFLSEYRQDFEKSYLLIDAGFTNRDKKTTSAKNSGTKSLFLTKFKMDLIQEDNIESNFELNLQKVSNDTFIKKYDINTQLIDRNENILKNSIIYDYQKDDMFFGATVSAYDDLSQVTNSKYEYLLPDITFDKTLLADKNLGLLDYSSNFRVRNYDVNRQEDFFVNNLDWKSNINILNNGLNSQFLAKVKTVNYSAENTKTFKNDQFTSELSGAFGYLAKLDLFKDNFSNKTLQRFTPKLLVRYAPGHMRDIKKSSTLRYSSLYKLNKVNEIDVIENGLSASVGFEYRNSTLKDDNTIKNENFSFRVGQVISDKENSDMAPNTSLDQRFSDVVGRTTFDLNKNVSFNYKFAIDQGYRKFNFNDFGVSLVSDAVGFNINFLEEKDHIGNQQYINSDINFNINNANTLSFTTKRNLLTNSAEFYNLSYNYINDCLKAGLVFKRAFYTDRDVEPENSLMFTISILPFGDISQSNK